MGLFDKIRQPLVDIAKSFSYDPEIKAITNSEENIFGFYSPSGGVGVTTLVANLAATIAASGRAVAVFDCNLMHPQLFRYLAKEQLEPPTSIADRFVNTAAPLMEFAAFAEKDELAVFSTRLGDVPADISQFDVKVIEAFYRELGESYDYVLIDMHGTLNDETVFAAASVCGKIFTLMRPLEGDCDSVYKDELVAISNQFGSRFLNIIQSPVYDFVFKAQDLKERMEMEPIVIANLPYCQYVARVGANYEVFVKTTAGTDVASQQYRDAIKHIAEVIVNYCEGEE